MSQPVFSSVPPDFHVAVHGRTVRVTLRGPVDKSTGSALIEALSRADLPKNASLHVDLQKVSRMDDFGTLVLLHLARQSSSPIRFEHVPPDLTRFVDMARTMGKASSSRPPCRPACWLERLGDTTLNMLHDSRNMLIFVGDVLLSLISVLRSPSRLRGDDTLIHMQRVGADALPIVALISFLLGLIMAFMSAVQLEQFGANIYVASLVSLSMVRELGPIMTAIIVAGRSGSAFAAEIGSMRVAEEIDALTTMGFDITAFLVLPRLLATLVVQPLLTLFSDFFAIAGGLVVGVTLLDLTTHGYMVQTINTISMSDVLWSVLKTMLFALLIAGTGCFRGFQVRGGADSVGRATTSSVVTSIFLIILADSILAVIQRYWG
ncbi:ABC transporter permease [Desulfoplanes formicivorans]|uniref:ABC transporter permease n=1 Tax=Desulfoplanes formicivorans TaxID=1592317 RepID=UPI0009F19FB8|nr:MlaE family lipid ABC transporter permease subunit [Desulfoplanes formicivorans]